MTSSAWWGMPIGRRIRTNIPGDKQPMAALRRGFGKTPRTRMLPVVGLTWLLTKLIFPWCGIALFALQAHEHRQLSPSLGSSIFPSLIARRIRRSVGSSISK